MISSVLHRYVTANQILAGGIYTNMCVCISVYRGLSRILSSLRIRWISHIWLNHTEIGDGGNTPLVCEVQVITKVWPEEYSGVQITVSITTESYQNAKNTEFTLCPLAERMISHQSWTIHSVWNTMPLGGFYSMNSNQMAGIFQWQKRTRRNMSGTANRNMSCKCSGKRAVNRIFVYSETKEVFWVGTPES